MQLEDFENHASFDHADQFLSALMVSSELCVMLRHAKTPRTNESERVSATTCATWFLQYADSPGPYSYPIQPHAVPRSRSFQIILCRVASAFDPPSVPMVVVDDLGTPRWVPELHIISYNHIYMYLILYLHVIQYI